MHSPISQATKLATKLFLSNGSNTELIAFMWEQQNQNNNNNNNNNNQIIIDILAAVIDLGYLLLLPTSVPQVETSSGLLGNAQNKDMVPYQDDVKIPLHISFIIDGILSEYKNKCNSTGNAVETAALLLSSLFKACNRTEELKQTCALLFQKFFCRFNDEANRDESPGRCLLVKKFAFKPAASKTFVGSFSLVLSTNTRIVFPRTNVDGFEKEAMFAMFVVKSFLRLFRQDNNNNNEDESNSCLYSPTFTELSSALARSSISIHPSILVECMIEAGYQVKNMETEEKQRIANKLNHGNNNNNHSTVLLESDGLQFSSSLNNNNHNNNNNLKPLEALRLLLGSQTAMELSITQAFSSMLARIRDAASDGDLEHLSLESDKAVFAVAFFLSSSSSSSSTTACPSAFFFSSLRSHAIPLLEQIFSLVSTPNNAFVSGNVHRAIAAATTDMARHSSSASTEPIIDKVPQEIPGEVEIIGRNYSIIKFPSPRPSWVVANVTTGASAVKAPSMLSTFVGVFNAAASLAADSVSLASSSSSSSCAVSVATFVNWLVRLGNYSHAKQVIEMGFRKELPFGAGSSVSDSILDSDAAIAATSSRTTDGGNASKYLEMNVFLTPNIVSNVGSVVDVVGRELMVRLVGGVELESLCHELRSEEQLRALNQNNSAMGSPSGSFVNNNNNNNNDGSSLLHLVIRRKFELLEENWSECWKLMEVARSHLAGYPIAVNALILLRSVHSALRVLKTLSSADSPSPSSSTSASTFVVVATKSRINFWLQQTTAFFSSFLAPCMLILPPVPLLSGLAHEVLELVENRADQRTIIEALPSIGTIMSQQRDAVHQLSYPSERIATVRHNALLAYCVSRLTDKTVATFSSVLAPVLHAAPKMVLDRLLQRAIAYPAVELQAVNAQLLKNSPPLVFLLLPVMATDRAHAAVANDESTAEARASAVATLLSLVWRQSWDSFAFGHVFDAIESSLAVPSRKALLFVIPFLKSIFSLLALKFCEGEKTYNTQQLESLHGGPLLRWWTCGDSEAMLSRWVAAMSFTPSLLQNTLWVQFEKVLSQNNSNNNNNNNNQNDDALSIATPLGVRLLWSLFQLLAETTSIYGEAKGSAEQNTLMSLTDQDVIQDLCRILIEGMRGKFDPRKYTSASSTSTVNNNNNNILSLQNLSKVAPRAFCILASNERIQARTSLLSIDGGLFDALAVNNNNNESIVITDPQLRQQHQLLSLLLCRNPLVLNSEESQADDDAAESRGNDDDNNNIGEKDPLFGIELLAASATSSPTPKDSSILKELQFYSLFWMLDLGDLEPLSSSEHSSLADATQFTRQLNDAKSKIELFARKAEKIAESSSRSKKKLEFDAKDDVRMMEKEQDIVKERSRIADTLFDKIINELFVFFENERNDEEDFVDGEETNRFENFCERFVISCMIPRAVGGATIDSLCVSAFIERLYEGIQNEEITLMNGNTNNNNKSENQQLNFYQILAVSLAGYFVRSFCSMMAAFTPAESKRGCVTLAKLFWFFAEHVDEETVLELSAFITQSTFGVLFNFASASTSDLIVNNNSNNANNNASNVPEFIQRTALNILEALRNFNANNATSSTASTTPRKTAAWSFPLTKTECRVLHPAVALHAKASSPLFASATKLYHYLKSRSAQLISTQVNNNNNNNAELGKGEDDQTLFAKARLGLDSCGNNDQPTSAVNNAIIQSIIQQSGGAAATIQKKQQANLTRAPAVAISSLVLDEAYEAGAALLLSIELDQIYASMAQESGGAEVEEDEQDETQQNQDDVADAADACTDSKSKNNVTQCNNDNEDERRGLGGDGDYNADEKKQAKSNDGDDSSSSSSDESSSSSVSASDDDNDGRSNSSYSSQGETNNRHDDDAALE